MRLDGPGRRPLHRDIRGLAADLEAGVHTHVLPYAQDCILRDEAPEAGSADRNCVGSFAKSLDQVIPELLVTVSR